MSETSTNRSMSPLANKTKGKHRVIRQSVPDGPECLPLISDCSDDEATNTEDEGTEIISRTTEATNDLEEGLSDDEDEDEDEDDGDEREWVPPHLPTPKARASRARFSQDSSMSSAGPSVTKSRISKLQREMQDLSLHAESDSDLSAYIPPSKKAHPVASISEDELDNEDLATVKKKQR